MAIWLLELYQNSVQWKPFVPIIWLMTAHASQVVLRTFIYSLSLAISLGMVSRVELQFTLKVLEQFLPEKV